LLTVACYSYKGGAGRSTSAANLAVELARNGNKVAIIDADLTAPGLHYIFNVEEMTKLDSYKGTHHLATGWLRAKEFFTEGVFFIDVGKLESNMEWGLPEGAVVSFLASSPGQHPNVKNDAEKPAGIIDNFESIKEELSTRGYNYLIIDSASGITPISVTCFHCCDLLLVFFRWTLQHVRGTIECVETLKKVNNKFKLDYTMQTVATSVPSDEELKGQTDEIRRKLLNDRAISRQALMNINAIPIVEIGEHLPFKWNESITNDPELFIPLAKYVNSLSRNKRGA
jgi:MinD-like ATPase involved in chromosome partitioning or flagellar assembly